eukprot:1177297-Karenia_brevis.AAC.1
MFVVPSHASPGLSDAIAEVVDGKGLQLTMTSFNAAISDSEKGWQWKRPASLPDEICGGGLSPSMTSCMCGGTSP